MLVKQTILGCIIILSVGEMCYALKPLRRQRRPTTTQTTRVKVQTTPLWAIRMSQYNCHLTRTCTHGGPRACAYDERFQLLAYFKDICAMYQFNCDAKGRHDYIIQHNMVCRLKSGFVGANRPIPEKDLPTTPTVTASIYRGINRTTEWWWQGSTTDQYKYLYTIKLN